MKSKQADSRQIHANCLLQQHLVTLQDATKVKGNAGCSCKLPSLRVFFSLCYASFYCIILPPPTSPLRRFSVDVQPESASLHQVPVFGCFRDGVVARNENKPDSARGSRGFVGVTLTRASVLSFHFYAHNQSNNFQRCIATDRWYRKYYIPECVVRTRSINHSPSRSC